MCVQRGKDVLKLYNVTTADSGWYTCIVANVYGHRQQSSWIEVLSLLDSSTVGSVGHNTSSVHLVLVVFGVGFTIVVAVIVGAVCWQRHRPPRSRPLMLKENSMYFQPLNLPIDLQWEIDRFQ